MKRHNTNIIRKVQGRRYVGSASIRLQNTECVIVEIDMRLKRPDVICMTDGGPGPGWRASPIIWFSASDDSFFCGKKITKANGAIAFPAFVGWRLYTAHRVGRYTIAAVFLRRNDDDDDDDQGQILTIDQPMQRNRQPR